MVCSQLVDRQLHVSITLFQNVPIHVLTLNQRGTLPRFHVVAVHSAFPALQQEQISITMRVSGVHGSSLG